jgi:hypothetical protein
MEAPDSVWEWITAGNAPAYLAVLGGAVAAYFAYRSSSASKKSAKAAQDQLDRLNRQDEREQAAKFSVWPASQTIVHPVNGVDPDRKMPYVVQYTIAVRNSSDAVIYDVQIYTVAAGAGLMHVAFGGSIPPSKSHHDIFSAKSVLPSKSVYVNSQMGVVFRDAQGYIWDRPPEGSLQRLEAEDRRALADRALKTFSECRAEVRDSNISDEPDSLVGVMYAVKDDTET